MKRILVAGAGLIGARHVSAVAAHAGATLVGLVDPDPKVTGPTHVPRFADLSEVDVAVDGVILATPTPLHGAQGEFVATRGWPMLIEKPVAASLSDAARLRSAVAAAGVGTLVGHHRRYHAVVNQLKTLIADGGIGTPVTVTAIWAMRKPDAYFDGNWRTAGGSPVMINLVHDIDLLRFVMGEITSVTALPGNALRGSGRIESGAVALAFESGATGTISFADTAASPWGFEAATGENPNIGTTGQDMLWITGTKGAVSFPSMTRWQGTEWSTPAQPLPGLRAENKQPPLAAQLDHFLDVIDGATPLIDVADATRTLEVTLDLERQLGQRTTGGNHARSAFA